MIPLPHREPDVPAGGAVDQDQAIRHPPLRPGEGRPQVVAGRSPDAERPAGHRRTGPGAGVPVEVDGAPRHPEAEHRPGVAPDRQGPGRHPGADPADVGDVAFQDQRAVAGVAVEVEEVAERCRLAADPGRQPGDLVAGAAGDEVGAKGVVDELDG